MTATNPTVTVTATDPRTAEPPSDKEPAMEPSPIDAPTPGVALVAPDAPPAPATTGTGADVPDIQWAMLDDTPLPPRKPKVVTTATWVLFGGLLLAGGFAAGAKVGHDHAPKASAAAVFGRTAAATATATATTVAGQTGTRPANAAAPAGNAAPAAAAATAGGFGAGGFGGTFGQVKLVDGNAMYLQDNQGNVLKVTLAAGGTVTVSKPGSFADLKPGDTVIVQGTAGDDGTSFTATAITPAGAAGGRAGRGTGTGTGTGTQGTGTAGGGLNG